jgi:phage gp29-like protein
MAILGPDGEPIEAEILRDEMAGPTTMGVRRPEGDHPSVGMTPERLATILRESIGIDPAVYLALAEEMEEKEPQYLSVLGVRKRSVSQLDITVEAASESADHRAHAAFIEQWLKRESLEDDLFNIMDAIGKGFSLNELVWDTSAKQWWVDQIEWRDPRWFQFDPVDLRTPLLKNAGVPQPLPPYKFLYLQGRAKSGLSIRGGLARTVAWLWLFKNYDMKGWVQFAEIYGQPIRIGKYHAGASETEKRQLLRAVSGIGRDFGAIIPQSMLIEFVEAGGKTGSVDIYERLANYCDQMISKVVLGQTTTTDAISGGHAVSKEHNDVRGDIEKADAKMLSSLLNKQLVKPMIAFNFGPQQAYPRIIIGRSEKIDVAIEAQAVSTLAAAGVALSAKEIRGKFGYSDPKDGDEIIGGKPEAQPEANPDTPPVTLPSKKPQPDKATLARLALAAAMADKGDIVDDLARQALEDDGWESIMHPMIAPLEVLLQKAIDDGLSIEQFKSQIGALQPQIDTSKLQSTLENAAFIARVAAEHGQDGQD